MNEARDRVSEILVELRSKVAENGNEITELLREATEAALEWDDRVQSKTIISQISIAGAMFHLGSCLLTFDRGNVKGVINNKEFRPIFNELGLNPFLIRLEAQTNEQVNEDNTFRPS